MILIFVILFWTSGLAFTKVKDSLGLFLLDVFQNQEEEDVLSFVSILVQAVFQKSIKKT